MKYIIFLKGKGIFLFYKFLVVMVVGGEVEFWLENVVVMMFLYILVFLNLFCF